MAMIYQKWWGKSEADWNEFGKNRAAMETGGAGHHGGLVMTCLRLSVSGGRAWLTDGSRLLGEV